MAELMGRNKYARHRRCAPNAVKKAIDSGRIKAAVVYDDAGKFVGINWEAADALWAQNTDPGEAAKNGKFYVVPPVQAPNGSAAAQAPCYSDVKPKATEIGSASSDRSTSVPPTPAGHNRTGEDLGQDNHRVPAQPALAADPAASPDGNLDLRDPEQPSAQREDDNATYLAARARKEQFAAKSAELAYLQTIGKLVDVAAVRQQLMEVLNQLKTSAMRIPDRKAQMLAAESDAARVNRILTEEIRSVFDECSRQFADDAAGGIEEPAPACS